MSVEDSTLLKITEEAESNGGEIVAYSCVLYGTLFNVEVNVEDLSR